MHAMPNDLVNNYVGGANTKLAQKEGSNEEFQLADRCASHDRDSASSQAEMKARRMATGNSTPKNRADRTRFEIGSDRDPMMVLKWYHPHLTRHAADCTLLEAAPEGCYLLRPSSDKSGDYVLSVKLSSSVQHIKVIKALSGGYKFGNCSFQNLESFRRHCEVEKPVIGGDSGITVILRYPYSRYIEDTHQYTDVVHHAVSNMVESGSDSENENEDDSWESIKDGLFVDPTTGKQINLAQTLAFSSREGYLTKLGQFRKSWRVRWFVLKNCILSYYKTKQSQKPIKSLNMAEAIAVEYDNSKDKEHCFRIKFPSRTFYVYANSTEDCQQWVELLQPLVRSQKKL